MSKSLGEHYNEDFYNKHVRGMSMSAEAVLGLIYGYYKPRTVIDVGCGQGAWLAVAESLGAEILKGVDGSWVKKEALISKNIDFSGVNFDQCMPELTERYDLCICLEVAEHVSEGNAKKFIDFLCSASDTVLFSAAIKYQGGENHINEQWPSYWIGFFKSNGYECLDILRDKLWNAETVDVWYKQNIFLFVKPDATPLDWRELKALEKPMPDIVHPITFENKIKKYKDMLEYPTLRFCLGCIKSYVVNSFRDFIGRGLKRPG